MDFNLTEEQIAFQNSVRSLADKYLKKDNNHVDAVDLKKPRLSLVVLFLLIEIDPIFFKYQPKIGINNNSFFRINTGELKIVCK